MYSQHLRRQGKSIMTSSPELYSLRQKTKKNKQTKTTLGKVAYAFNYSTPETGTGTSLWIQDQASLPIEFQES